MNTRKLIRLFAYSLSLVLASAMLSACSAVDLFTDPLVAACAQPAFNVTKFEDANDGICTAADCSLREAVITANACEGEDVINLAEGSYANTLTAESATAGGSGPFEITDDLTINGNGAEVDGTLLASRSSINVSLQDLMVEGIENHGVMTITAVTTGHINNQGRLTGSDVEVADGSGIRNTGILRITGGSVVRNSGTSTGGSYLTGAIFAIENDRGRLTLEDVLVADNTSRNNGFDEVPQAAGILSNGYTELTRVEIRDNNSPVSGGLGLVVFEPDEPTVLSEVQISGHGTIGLWVSAMDTTIELVDSQIIDNSGSAVFNGTGSNLIIRRSTIARNGLWGSMCGAVGQEGGSLLIESSTLSGNTNPGEGCGVVWSDAGEVDIVASTIYGNEYPAVFNLPSTTGNVEIRGSIVADNDGDNCLNPLVTSGGFNLFDDDTCSPDETLGDLVDSSGALGLGPLADNGGPTQTHALEEGSPALDAAGDSCPSTDQRGIPRPAGSACDIGAYEAGEIVTMSGELPEGVPFGPTTCRFGPKAIYPPINFLSEGQVVSLLSRNEEASWLEVQSLDGQVGPCWVDVDLLDIAPTVELPALELGYIPPEPTWTPTAEPDSGGGDGTPGCIVDYNPDNSPVCEKPCQTPNNYGPC